MHVAWKFLDKRSAAIAAIRAEKDMDFIIENTPDEIREQKILMTSPQSSKLSDMPAGQRNPKRGEQRVVSIIEELDVLRERYRQAMEYMAWFKPAWNELNRTEQTILSELYQSKSLRDGAIGRLMKELGYSRSHVDRLRSRALAHISALLFGL